VRAREHAGRRPDHAGARWCATCASRSS
jgi:hypothetical protein